MRELFSARRAVTHPLAWVIEPLEPEPTLVVRAMFGGKAVYLQGRMVLHLTAKEEPWRGLLVPTAHEHHPALLAERPALVVHPILGKWLYLSENVASFERDAAWLVARIRARDPRVGVEPGPRRPRRHQGKTHFRKRG